MCVLLFVVDSPEQMAKLVCMDCLSLCREREGKQKKFGMKG